MAEINNGLNNDTNAEIDMDEKLKERQQQFSEKLDMLLRIFILKNRNYGDNYFTEEYSPLERWMSIKRKVARLSAHYQNNITSTLPDEKLEDTWSDMAIYCIMELIHMDLDKKEKLK